MVIATNTAATNYLGTLDGKFAVDPDGGASYSILLKLPPGTAGMLPKLSLGYNSGGGNGLLGVGWALQGLSAITRSPQTPAQDNGVRGAITYGNSDRYSLDGERLMVVNNVDYNDTTAIYHTERESWQKVVPIYTSNRPAGRNGPDGFLVHHKDGKVLEYGNTADSQIPVSSSNPTIRQWCVNKVTDRNGNYFTITYTYDATNNTNYPKQIDYTGNTKTGLTPQRSVVFLYEDRPDYFPRYLGGYPVATTQRLHQVQTLLDSKLIRTYTLAYIQGVATGRSQLASITEADAQGHALSPTTFDWQDGVAEVFSASQSLSLATPPPEGGQSLPMDFNGDGLIDLVYAISSGDDSNLQLTLLQSNGQQVSNVGDVPTDIYYDPQSCQLLPMDVNGDGCIDLVCAYPSGDTVAVDVLVSTCLDGQWTLVRSTIPALPANLNLPAGGSFLAMDVDGDGLTDLVYVTSYGDAGYVQLQVLFSEGNGQFTAAPAICQTQLVSGGQFSPMDVTGNQMTDLIYSYQNGNNTEFAVLLSQGRNNSGFLAPTLFPTNIVYGASVVGVDANGDGLGDVLLAYLDVDMNGNNQLNLQLYCSNGMNASGEVNFTPLPLQTFSESELPLSSSLPIIAPTNATGSGLADLVLTWGSGEQTAIALLHGTGTSFSVLQNVTQPSAEVVAGANLVPLDLSGNGKTSLLFTFSSGDNLALSAMPTAGHFPDLMTTITNGLGGTINISYAPLTDSTVYTKNAPNSASNQFEVCNLLTTAVSGATFPLAAAGNSPNPGTTGTTYGVKLVDFPKYVVLSHSKGDGRGNTYTFQHRYAAARMDTTGRGWLGFQTVTVIDVEMQKQTQTTYGQLFPETHSPQIVTVTRSTDDALMRKDAYTYQSQTNAPNTGASIHLVQPTQLQVDYYTFADASNPVPDCTEIKSMEYDEFGNETLLGETGSAVGAPLYTIHAYQNDAANWRLGFVTEQKQSADSAGNQVFTWAKTVYAPTTLDQTQHQLWNDQTQQWQTTTYTYDDYGNRLTVTDVSGAVVTFTYDDTYHAFKHTETGTNAAGKTLTTTTTYYPEFGVVNTKTDPNNVTKTQVVDGLGRMTQTQGPDPTGNTITLAEVSWATDSTGTYRKTVTPAGWKQEYVDGLKRAYRTTALGADGSSTVIVDKTLNGQGKVLTQSLPYYEGNTPLWLTNTYDNYGRLIQVVKPYQKTTLTTTMVFEKVNQMTQTEAKGQTDTRVTQTVYNTFNGKRHPISQTHVLSNEQTATTTYAYDGLGRLLNITDPVGVANGATYDSLSRKISSWQEINGVKQFVHTYQHDDASRKLIHTDPKGTVSTQIYDPLGRLIERDMQPAANSTMQPKKTTYTLDDPTHAYSQGKVSSVTLSDGEVYLFEYDPCGNQAKTTIQLDGESYLFEKVYNVLGQVQTLTFPDGSVQTNSYNAAAKRDGVSLQNGTKAQQAAAKYTAFNAFGMPTNATIGIETFMDMAYEFDDTGLLNSQSLKGANGTAIASTSFAWNDFHQLNGIQDEVTPDNSQSYQYDPVGRLQNASGDYGDQGYEYDLGGNLTLKDGITYQSDGHQVKTGTQNGETVFNAEYDDNGNMTSATRNGVTTTYTYDADNYLVQSGNVTITYDYTGRRLKKQIQGGMTTYYLAPYYQVNIFPNGAKQHTVFVMGNHGVLAAVTGVDAGTPPSPPPKGVPAPGVFYLYQDHLQNSVYQIDPQGNKTTSIRYRPFGEIHQLEGDDTVQQKFTGKEWDDSLQLYYFGARYYDPSLGRFITQDDQLGAPLGHHDALHRYCYTTNDPTNLVDPDGHAAWWQFLYHFVVDAVAIAAGIALMALTPFSAGLSAVAGSTLLGFGLSGLVSDITTCVDLGKHHKFDGKYDNNVDNQWGIQLGIGAAGGFITGGLGAGAGALVGRAASAIQTVFAATEQTAQRAANVVMNYVVGGVIANAGSGALGTFMNNAATGQSLSQGVGFAALMGGALGVMGTGGNELATNKLSSAVEATQADVQAGLEDAISMKTTYLDLVADTEENYAARMQVRFSKMAAEAALEDSQAKVAALFKSKIYKVAIATPGIAATVADASLGLSSNFPNW